MPRHQNTKEIVDVALPQNVAVYDDCEDDSSLTNDDEAQKKKKKMPKLPAKSLGANCNML